MDIRLEISDLDCDPLERSETTMILTCPECATRFFVADDAIGLTGRQVECDACHEVWFSGGLDSAVPTDIVAEPAATSPTILTETSTPETADEAAPIGPPLFAERALSARKTPAQRPVRPWAVVLLILAFAIAASAFVFQRQVERVFPGAATVYRSVGIRSADRAGG